MPPPLPSPSPAESWMRGVAANPAAPADVLLRLLDPAGAAAWPVLCGERALPAAVVEAVIRHPERAVRRPFARNRLVDPALRGRLVDDPDDLVRCSLAGGWPRYLGRPRLLPDDVVEKLLLCADDGGDRMVTSAEIVEELVFSGQIRHGFHEVMFQHPDPRLRIWAVGYWRWMSPEQRQALLSDADPSVRDEARRQARFEDPEALAAELPESDCHWRSTLLIAYPVSRAVVEDCFTSGRDLRALAHNPHTPADVVARLARDPDPKVRERVASRADLDPALLAELADDPEAVVRTRALVHPLPRTWPQQAAIDRVIGKTADKIGQVEDMVEGPDGAWYEACAESAHPLLHRVAATFAGLPPAVVDRLAADPDAEVRHLLAFNHPQAPARLLLEAFIACPCQRRLLLALPHMPRTGLSELATHDDPEVRALAAGDPTLGEPLDALLADADLGVRRAAAANPQVDTQRLATLLAEPELAEAAAANPRLSAEQLHELLDRAGIPPFQDGG